MVHIRGTLGVLAALALVLVAGLACASNVLSPTPTALPLEAQAEPTARPTQSARPASTATSIPATVSANATAEPEPASLEDTPATAETAKVAPARIMAVGQRLSLTLRSLPNANAPTIATLPGSDVLWAEARSGDGQWLHVTFGENAAHGWAASEDVALLGEPDTLPVREPDALPDPTQSAVSGGSPLVARIAASRLNVRSGPGLDQPLLGQLAGEDTVTLIGRSSQGQWFAIQWPSGTGWVAAQYVTADDAARALPVLAEDTTSASVPLPGIPGKVVLQTRNGGDIYIVNADGSGLRRLGEGFDPALSPDGTQVAYTRWGSPHSVFVLDLDSGQERRVTSANRPRGPTWSPDGSRLVFSHMTGTSTCLATPFGCLDEGTVRQFLGGQECVDTPYGHYCISDFPIRTVEETGLAQTSLGDGGWLDLAAAPGAQSPHYHPSYEEILYRDKQGLQITMPTGEMRTLVERSDMGSPAWSPDGQQIVVQMHVHDHTDIFLLDAAGNVLRSLTAPGIGERATNNVAPAWSPDGRYIIFLSDRDGTWRLYWMNADGSRQEPFLPTTLNSLSLTYEFAAERMASWGP